ncbi:restriction endonuclease subunit S [Micromonospora sp. RL09-050-HVF-A]|uniref:restriction endonuclease subunit S n=1 Tax=Micromonospora sp. RL09-050-HVF-A TaxID=1703433 RepID=UPI001C5E8F6E|nr:restriction endonuclease subunit S [Micromonospora sp. RL09-050-HVF-A]MBW4702287.1 restriction endonuclease subunit S [Micromonospora sp. RL09-050-HVF-A]
MTDLPPGWTEVTLGEIAESVKNGIFVSRPGLEPNGVPILRISSVRPGVLNLGDIRYSTRDMHELRDSDALLLPGDLLFTRYNGNIDFVGACARVPEGTGDLTYPDKLIRVRVNPAFADSRYVQYAFEAPRVRSLVRAVARTTAGQAGISGANLKSITLPIPPLAEQRRIVAVIEEQVVRCDAASEQVRRAAARAVRLREAGREYARLNAQGGELVRLGDILAVPLRNGHSAPAAAGGAVRTLTLTAITRSEFVDDFTKMTAVDPLRVGDLWLKSGDILIQRSNTPELVGTAAIYEGPDDWAIFPDLVIRVRVNETALPAFVALMLQTPAARNYFRSRAKGLAGSMPKIDQQVVQDFSFRLPSRDRQAEIVNRFREFLAIVDRVSDACQRSIVKARLLRSSLLMEAFAGRLVAQDPNDESAAELLARIRAERAATIPKQRTRSRRTPRELAAPPTRVTGDDYQQETLPL